MRQGRLLILMVVAVLVASACSRRQPPAQPAPTGGPPTTNPTPPPPPPPPPSRGEDPEAAALAAMCNTIRARVHFDYDRSDIRQGDAAVLQQKVPVLQQNSGVRLRIEGHADERGSVEYNLALGLRRAQSVKDYLAGYGIDASRIAVESYGEDRPLSSGTTEAAYAQNRRAEFVVTAGLGC